jgi:hypothetical protein
MCSDVLLVGESASKKSKRLARPCRRLQKRIVEIQIGAERARDKRILARVGRFVRKININSTEDTRIGLRSLHA